MEFLITFAERKRVDEAEKQKEQQSSEEKE